MKAGRLSRYLLHCRPCKPKIPAHLIVFLCIHTSAGMPLWISELSPHWLYRQKSPFLLAYCFLLLSSPSSSSPFFHTMTFWRLGMETQEKFCLDLPLLMFAKHDSSIILPAAALQSTESISDMCLYVFCDMKKLLTGSFWVFDRHSNACFLFCLFYLFGWHSNFLEDHEFIKVWEQKTVQNYFIYWLQKKGCGSGKENPFIVLFLKKT